MLFVVFLLLTVNVIQPRGLRYSLSEKIEEERS